jgi:cation diffusion facilitator CzcD-associated flavoprotein CzcO
LEHEVQGARWIPRDAQWEVDVKDLKSGETTTHRADFFVSAQGRIDVPKIPAIPGLLETFKGDVIHTARWPGGYSVKGKRVAVIGNGASGIQILPNIHSDVEHLDHYVRSKIWVYSTFTKNLFSATAEQPGGHQYTDEERALFRQDPQAHLEHRRNFDKNFHGVVNGSDILGSAANAEVRERVTKTMLERLGGDEEWLQRILPDFAPGCKRPTPAPGYLEALRSPKTSYIDTKIVRADETGLVTEDGTHRPVDTVICATGFNITYTPVFPLIGKNGVDLRDQWGPGSEAGYPETYFGVMAPGFPNFFNIQGVSFLRNLLFPFSSPILMVFQLSTGII